ncbi:MAG: HAMP domain-containing histidine kinase [Lachnospiraceae bacterium]|nr:HAMP domain-containing histidine kinase [Lachnospiraceae bacterium]
MANVGILGGVIVALGITTIVGIIYFIRYYMVRADLKSACEQLKEIRQSPEENRILLVEHTNLYMEKFLQECNSYIGQNQQMRIHYANRERKLRRQIEAISHDLRTPLTALLGYMELLDLEEYDEESRESLEVVERKAKSLQRLITNFYDLSRLELDDYQLTMAPMELSRFVRESLLLYYNDLEQRGLDMRVDCEKSIQIQADEGAIGRVLGNMIQNAIRYAESYLAVSVGVEDGCAYLLFENDTAALREQDIPHLFERFYMSDAARSGQGTGLGLTISKLLVEAMGGHAEARLVNGALQIKYTFPVNI